MSQSSPPHLQKANELKKLLASESYGNMASSLEAEAIAESLSVQSSHKSHPVADILQAAGSVGSEHARIVLGNLEYALSALSHDTTGVALQWAKKHLNEAAREKNIENAAAMLAEVRAFGFLWDAGFSASSLRTGREPKRDFDAMIDDSVLGVEVTCKQMNADQAQQLAQALDEGPGTHFVYPAGYTKKGETTAENVASKFAQIKPHASQVSNHIPTILWLDLQDKDWWPVRASHAKPVELHKDHFSCGGFCYSSGGLWHAIYGIKGAPIFEYNSDNPNLFKGVPIMAHEGLFSQSPSWAAVVLSLPQTTIIFENPNTKLSLNETLRKKPDEFEMDGVSNLAD